MVQNDIEMNKMKIKVLRLSIDGRSCYIRIPVARKIMGTGPHDSEILINAGISESLMDIAYNLETGVYSLDSVLSQKKGYCGAFSTTRLLQLLPVSFERDGAKFGIMLYPGKSDGSGRSSLVGVIVNIDSGDSVETFHGHPVSVLVKLIEFAARQ